MNTGSVEDRLAIRELVETFAIATSRIDAELWGATWAEDGSWKLPSMEEAVTGRAEIVAAFRQKLDYVALIAMMSVPTALVIEGERAQGQAQCQELIFPKAGGRVTVVGCFDDEYVKRGGRWLFLSRRYEVLAMQQSEST